MSFPALIMNDQITVIYSWSFWMKDRKIVFLNTEAYHTKTIHSSSNNFKEVEQTGRRTTC